MHVNEIPTPALIVIKSRVENNCQQMLKRAKDYGVQLRPHIKTSKCVEVAVMQTGGTKACLEVSTLVGAEKLFEAGFTDILYAYPLPLHNIERCKKIAYKHDFSVMVDCVQVAQALQNTPLDNGKKWSVMMKINCDNGRAGIPSNSQAMVDLAKSMDAMAHVNFKGVYAHCGDSYDAVDVEGVQRVAHKTARSTLDSVERIKSAGVKCETYGIGSTPTCSNPCDIMRELTEWHPGNYVFYDKMQERTASCVESDIACYVATRVVAHYPESGYMLVDCGFLALSLHGGGNCYGKAPGSGFGRIAGCDDLKLDHMSQEHGIVMSSLPNEKIDFSKYPLGTLLQIYPDHSCATCAMYPFYYVVDDDEKVIDKWYPYRGW